MSGIAGVVADDGTPLDPHIAARLIAAAPVRGFDGTTYWQDGPACLIRHHHATTPQAVGETQPLVSRDGRTVMMLDGRIDNRGEIIDFLSRDDCRDDAPDVALVLALFERLGEGCVTRLVGDWALVAWSTQDRGLFLARSPMGWRPLMWNHANGVFAFSTEPRALLKGLRLDHTPNEGSIGEFLSARFVTRTETLWRGVQQIEQGGAMRIAHGAVRAWHWHVIDDPIDESLSDVDHIDRFNTLFTQAVLATNRSNTPVWAQLSGGLDSSSVVTRATELHRLGLIAPVQAVSARFPNLPHDETHWSSAVEEKLGITAQVVGSEGYSFEEAHRWVSETYQLPIRPNVFDATTASLRLMKGRARILLTGEGGDDWMGGTIARFPDLLVQGRLATMMREAIVDFPGDPLWRQLTRAAWWGAAPLLSTGYRQRIDLGHMADTRALPAWVDARWARSTGLVDRFRAASPSAQFSNHVQQFRYANFDRAKRFVHFGNIIAFAEQHGVELRHPFHDLRLTRFFMTAAPRMIKRGGLRKIVLREAMRGELAESVRIRRDKAEFSHNFAYAIAKRVRERPVETMLPVMLGWVDGSVMTQMADLCCSLYDHLDTEAMQGLIPLWNIISLDIWLTDATAG